MNRIVRAFRDHPATVGETYFEHMRSALGFAVTMIGAAICCAIHAFLPFLFERTGSTAIDELYRRMIRQRASRFAQRSMTHTGERQGQNTRSSRAAA